MSLLFYKSISEYLQTVGSIEVDLSANEQGIIAIHEKKLLLILLPTLGIYEPGKLPTENQYSTYKRIYIHEDLWYAKKAILVSRLQQVFGLNQRLSGRKCLVLGIEKLASEDFLNQNHLLGSCLAATRLGLFHQNELVAVGTFSKSRVMVDGITYYRSFEMLRFAVKAGYSVTGGLDKILQYFIKAKNVVHLMTYIDNEWGNGEAFLRLGFKPTTSTESQEYWVDPNTMQRGKLKSSFPSPTQLIERKNMGSTKLVLDLRPYVT